MEKSVLQSIYTLVPFLQTQRSITTKICIFSADIRKLRNLQKQERKFGAIVRTHFYCFASNVNLECSRFYSHLLLISGLGSIFEVLQLTKKVAKIIGNLIPLFWFGLIKNASKFSKIFKSKPIFCDCFQHKVGLSRRRSDVVQSIDWRAKRRFSLNEKLLKTENIFH